MSKSRTVRLRNPDRVVGVPMSMDSKKAYEQRQRWISKGWDEISLNGGQSWQSLESVGYEGSYD